MSQIMIAINKAIPERRRFFINKLQTNICKREWGQLGRIRFGEYTSTVSTTGLLGRWELYQTVLLHAEHGYTTTHGFKFIGLIFPPQLLANQSGQRGSFHSGGNQLPDYCYLTLGKITPTIPHGEGPDGMISPRSEILFRL